MIKVLLVTVLTALSLGAELKPLVQK